MKIVAGFLAVLVLAMALWLGRDGGLSRTLPSYRELEPGEVAPDLVKVGETWPLTPGTRLWFRPGVTSYGTVVEADGELLRVAWSYGGSGWLEREQIKGSFIAAKPGRVSKKP